MTIGDDVSDEPPVDTTRGKVAALIVIALLLLCGFWLTHRLGNAGAVQDCVASGHRDCGQADANAP
jgi:hypothetical protein